MGHRYSTEKAEAFKLEGIIIENTIKENVVLEVEDVRSIKEINLRLCEGKNYALLVDPKEGSSITDEARALLASPELGQYNLAKAILIHTNKQKIIGNIYLRVNKPFVKTRMFTNREKALVWLRQQISDASAKAILAAGNL
jgi:hypothetical protein